MYLQIFFPDPAIAEQLEIGCTSNKNMAKSFRRILLSHLLPLSIPIILLGVGAAYFVTYRKTRSGLLETARQNLTESAVRRGTEIINSVDALKSNLVLASNTTILRNGEKQKYPDFLEQLSQKLPTRIECLQLIDATTKESLANTCEGEVLGKIEQTSWPQQQENILLPLSRVEIRPVLPENVSDKETCQKQTPSTANQLKLLVSVPVYNPDRRLNSILVARSVILEPSVVEPRSLAGSTAIINEAGTILAHPCLERVGRNIEQESGGDNKRLDSILRKARAGEQNFAHLFAFEEKDIELLAGYAGIPNPIPEERERVWLVVTMTPLEDALAALNETQQFLWIWLPSITLALFLGTIAVIFYVSRKIAKPLERLIKVIGEIDPLTPQKPLPSDFQVHEFNQVSLAFNGTIEHIRDSYELLNRTLEKAIKTTGEMRKAKDGLQRALESEQLARENLRKIQHRLEDSLRAEQLANDRLYEVLLLVFDHVGNPLNGLISNLVFVQDYFDEIGQNNQDLEEAYESAIRLDKNVKEISQLFSVNDNNFFPDIQKVNLHDIVQKATEKYSAKIQEKGIELHLPEWSDRELMIFADFTELTGILEVLLDNAVRHTQKGSISIKIDIENVDRQTQTSQEQKDIFYPTGQRACIIIQDTGCGMDRVELDRLNNPRKTRTTTGLSIVIARILLEMMDGIMVFESEGSGKGTIVRLCLPTAKNDVS
ncbi:MAG: ATP-binding protein [Spirulina sp.]